ncbi:MAG: mechanosensitive ion channel domain-containing protein [Woeseiaceae bacterium]|jgi:small-conductance mechanosensitive channel
MLQDFRTLWDTVLFTAPSGQVITIGQLALVVALLVFGYLGSRFIGYLIGKRLANTKLRPDIVYAFKRITFFTIFILIVLTALGLLGIPLTTFHFATGALAIGVGFGAQNIINNFISGWILMTERPIRIGDFIEIDDWQGVVETIGNRSTRIRRSDGVHLLVPNSALLERTVVNWTLVDLEIRTTVRVGVAYGSPVTQVADLIMQAVQAEAQVKQEPPPTVVFEDFGDNALIFDAYFWCDVGGEKALREIRSSIRFGISAAFENSGIVIAFPQRDVHLDASKPLEIRMIGDHGQH